MLPRSSLLSNVLGVVRSARGAAVGTSLPAAPAAGSRTEPGSASAITDRELQWREAALLWLRWNETYERGAEALFAAGADPQRREELLDQADALRTRAVAACRRLLD